MNFLNNLMGAVAPAVTGFLVGATNRSRTAFLVAGVVLLIGIFSYVFVLGRIEPIPEPAGEPARVPSAVSEDKPAEALPPRPIALVIMGVSGSGKSTVGEKLAERLGWTMAEGDRLHPPENVEKMRQGVPLTDEDRAPGSTGSARSSRTGPPRAGPGS